MPRVVIFLSHGTRREARRDLLWVIVYAPRHPTGRFDAMAQHVMVGILLVVLKRTRLGLDIRAVSQNRAMARAIGIRSDRVDAMTFGLGSGIAGVAGVALSQLTNVGPNLGQS